MVVIKRCDNESGVGRGKSERCKGEFLWHENQTVGKKRKVLGEKGKKETV